MELHIPKIKVKARKRKLPLWMNKKVLKEVRKKYKAFQRYLGSEPGIEFQKTIDKQNKSKKKGKKEYIKYIRKRNKCKKNY